MALLNENYLKLKAGYLFPEIRRRTEAFVDSHPQAAIIKMGIGDVVRGIPRPVADAMKAACEELAGKMIDVVDVSVDHAVSVLHVGRREGDLSYEITPEPR